METGGSDGVATTEEVAADFFLAYDERDFEMLERLYVAEATHREVALGRTTDGGSKIVAGLRAFLDAIPDARWTERQSLVVPTGAAVSYRLRGTLAAPMAGIEARLQPLNLEGLMLIEVKD